MDVNSVPKFDMSDNPTGCCPRFDPTGWDEQELHFKDKRFLKARTRSLLHIPLNMGSVFKKTLKAIEEADALGPVDIQMFKGDSLLRRNLIQG